MLDLNDFLQNFLNYGIQKWYIRSIHADDTPDPIESDMRYYRIVDAWKNNDNLELSFVTATIKQVLFRIPVSGQRLKILFSRGLRNSKKFITYHR